MLYRAFRFSGVGRWAALLSGVMGFLIVCLKVLRVRLLPLPAWCDPELTLRFANTSDKPLHGESGRVLFEVEAACIDLAQQCLPRKLLRRFDGTTGRYVLRVIATGGTLHAFPDLQRSFGIAEWRAIRILVAHPHFEDMISNYQAAFYDWIEAKDAAEKADREYAIDIENTYRSIERDIWSEAHRECAELGLV
jgi:hypothetical protein